MLKHTTLVRVYCQTLLPSTSFLCVKNRNYSNDRNSNRNYYNNPNPNDKKKAERYWKLTEAKKLNPVDVAVKSSRPLKRRSTDEFADHNFDKFQNIIDPEFRRDITNIDMDHEPDLAQLDEEYQSHVNERRHQKKIMRRRNAARKYFKEYIPKEVSMLTWAEKENIRFLHKSNPDDWNPETIAAAFPITPSGVEKLLKSTFRCYSKEDILHHDKHVKTKMQLIKNGTIQLTPELREKMKIREKIPIQLGMTPSNSSELDFVKAPKPLGEFARLVASKEKIREVEDKLRKASNQETVEDKKAKMDELFVQEMKKLNIRQNDRLTLSQFEEKLKGSPSLRSNENLNYQSVDDEDKKSSLIESIPQVKYLLEKEQAKKAQPSPVSEIIEESNSSKDGPSAEDFLISYIPKFKPQTTEDGQDIDDPKKPSIKFDNGEAYIYDSQTGYHKPFAPASCSEEDRIEIPKDKQVPGATYQVGDKYYDEDGEFLYRVV